MTGQLTSALVAAASRPLVNWVSLGEVLLLALSTAVVIVGGFSLGLATLDAYLSSARRRAAQADGPAAAAVRVKRDSLAVALLAFGVCAAALGLGLWAMLVR
jgi:hypothetical protein